jgi:AraC-like DNA-binding protein
MHCGALLCEYAAWLEETRFRSLPREAMIEHAERVALKSLDAYMDVRAFAAAAGFGPSRFHEVYHAARGITPYRFLLNARMERARALLFETELDIATIASQLGYADASTFGRVFRRIHGVTPGGWRDHAQSDAG